MNTINKIATRFLLGVAAVAFTATSALSAPITIPAGLNPGDQYRLAFVTTTTRDGTSSNIADYNEFVSAAANSQTELTALGTRWMAIVSTFTIDARDNTGTNPSSTGVPIYLLDGNKIADNNADLWDGNLDAALNITETGAPTVLADDDVWTGSTQFGLAFAGARLGEGVGNVLVGSSNSTNSLWITANVESEFSQNSLYGISGVLTVTAVTTVPEPGALGVLALGLLGLGFARRKKQAA